MNLTREESAGLDAFADDDLEPMEEVFFTLKGLGITLASEQLLTLMFRRYDKWLVTIQQSPIMDQAFPERGIEPSKPGDVTGDLDAEFRKFHAREDYLERIDGSGLPFGIYFRLTEKGRAEHGKPEYASFFPDE